MKSFSKFLVTIFVVLSVGCSHDDGKNQESKANMPSRDINEVKDAHTEELMKIPGVVAVYVGALDDGTPCIGVMVISKTDELEQKIPKMLEGFPVVMNVSGEIKPMNK